jgi:hypothetical protein
LIQVQVEIQDKEIKVIPWDRVKLVEEAKEVFLQFLKIRGHNGIHNF